MEVVRTIKPGEKGSQRYHEKYGERLVAVRYRKDDNGQLLTTIEVVVDRKPPREKHIRYDAVDAERNRKWVALRIDYAETALRQQVKKVGGWWDKKDRVWRLEYQRVVALGLIDRVISPVDRGVQI